ncbi:MAG: octanoyltransferase [Gammaproteobacteria bacterium RIFCSPHIGHO2_12_FULL_38_14]|nr:MAG: octanoyltransferase [Gammaproteobacteria bacterium RIFCSPHIGHO2_12_FULL_38_14]
MTYEKKLIIRWFDHPRLYLTTWEAMQKFTAMRTEQTIDEIWLLEHEPVFTQGQNGKQEHVLDPKQIPIVKTDRGGQVTYHGPGQLMAYTLIDLKRKQFGIRQFVTLLEQSVVDLLSSLNIAAKTHCHAPGVYVNEQKICSIGLRIRKGCSYHGIALNVQMDLSPFLQIHPCGFKDLSMTQITAFNDDQSTQTIGRNLITYLTKNLGYTTAQYLAESLT